MVAQHMQLVSKKNSVLLSNLRSQHDVEAGGGQDCQQQSSHRVRLPSSETPRVLRRRRLAGALSLGFKNIARATNSVNQLNREGIVDFAAEPADVYVDDVGVTVEIHVPDRFSDQRARQHFSWTPRQKVRSTNPFAVKIDFLPARVARWRNRSISRSAMRIVSWARGVDRRSSERTRATQFGKCEWLHQVIVRSQLEPCTRSCTASRAVSIRTQRFPACLDQATSTCHPS